MIVSDTIWHPDLSGAGRSKYKALAQAIREGIVSGQLTPGSQMPPVRELGYRLGVTPGTVARAYSVLTDEGRLVAGVGRGTFVSEGPSAPVERKPWVPPMMDPVLDTPEKAHLLSPKMPDMGQVALIRDGMARLAQTMSPESLLRYPTRTSDHAARAMHLSTLDQDHTGPCTADDIVVANGGQNAITMILQTVLRGAHPVIAMDALGYGGYRSAALISRGEVVAVPWDDEGPDAAAFEALVKAKSVKLFCTSAEVCNPTVKTTSIARREEIARIAGRYGVHILDDDCYRLMRTRYRGPSYRALVPDLGWYVTSPSKSITAALRIGFAVAARGWADTLARTATFNAFGVTQLITDLYVEMMKAPELPAVIDGVKDRIAQDVRAAVNILGTHQLEWSEDVPFLFLHLPEGWRVGEFCQAADMAGVLIKSADDFALRDSRTTHAVRIAINGQVSHEYFVGAMHKLRNLLDSPPERFAV